MSATQYLRHRVEEGHDPRSYQSLFGFWSDVLEQPPEMVDSERIRRCLNRSDLSPATRNAYLSVLSGYCQWLKDRGELDQNPCRLVPRVKKINNARRSYLSRQEYHSLIEHMECPRVRDAVVIAVKTGMRWGRIRSIKVADLRRDKGGRWYDERPGKNGRLHRVTFVGEAAKIVQRNLDQTWAFPGPDGGQLRSKWMTKQMIRACSMSGLTYGSGKYEVSFHTLRATFATLMNQRGASLKEIMDAGDWLTPIMPLRYIRDVEESALRGFERMAKI